jgi:hypothetical protein
MKSNKELKGCTKWNKRFENVINFFLKRLQVVATSCIKKKGLKKKEDKKSKVWSITCIY